MPERNDRGEPLPSPALPPMVTKVTPSPAFEERPPESATKAPDPELPTATEHAIATGNLRRATPTVAFGRAGEQPVPTEELVFSPEHRQASQLHGWIEHEHHAGAPFRLTLEAYEAALKAGNEPVTRVVKAPGQPGDKLDAEQVAKHVANKEAAKGELVTDYEPHEPALSEHSHLGRLLKAKRK